MINWDDYKKAPDSKKPIVVIPLNDVPSPNGFQGMPLCTPITPHRMYLTVHLGDETVDKIHELSVPDVDKFVPITIQAQMREDGGLNYGYQVNDSDEVSTLTTSPNTSGAESFLCLWVKSHHAETLLCRTFTVEDNGQWASFFFAVRKRYADKGLDVSDMKYIGYPD